MTDDIRKAVIRLALLRSKKPANKATLPYQFILNPVKQGEQVHHRSNTQGIERKLYDTTGSKFKIG